MSILFDRFVDLGKIKGNNLKLTAEKMKYRRCRPEKRIYRNLLLGILTFIVFASVLPTIN